MRIGILFSIQILMISYCPAQLAIPFPYNETIGLSREQAFRIAVIHDSVATEIRNELDKDRIAIIDFNTTHNTPFLTDIDTAGLAVRLHMYYDPEERQKIDKLLYPLQWHWADILWASKEYENSVIHFDRYKRKQIGNSLCWAACLQMVFNYSGVNFSQEQIIQLVRGSYANEEAGFDEIFAAINFGHVNFRDSTQGTWLASIERKDNDIDGLLSNVITPFPIGPGMPAYMLGGTKQLRFALLGINKSHLAIIEKFRYRLVNGRRIPIAITYYDPLTDEDVLLKWEDTPLVITDWFSCVAVRWINIKL